MKILSVQSNAICENGFSVNFEHGRGFFLYVLFKSRTLLWLNGKYVPVMPGTGICYDRTARQCYRGGDGEFDHDFLLFDAENTSEQLLIDSIPKNIPFYHPFPDTLSAAIREIEAEKQTPSEYREKLLSGLCTAFVYRLLNDAKFTDSAKGTAVNYDKLYRLRTELYRNPEQFRSVPDACGKVCLSPSRFQHLYREFFGVAFSADLIRARLERAKLLLLGSEEKISVIGGVCGYNNPEHFIRQFTEHVGISPGNFRKVGRENTDVFRESNK